MLSGSPIAALGALFCREDVDSLSRTIRTSDSPKVPYGSMSTPVAVVMWLSSVVEVLSKPDSDVG
jgi:hypothetical protein